MFKKNLVAKIVLLIVIFLSILIFSLSIIFSSFKNPLNKICVEVINAIKPPFVLLSKTLSIKDDSNSNDSETFTYKNLYYETLLKYNRLNSKYISERLSKAELLELKKLQKLFDNIDLKEYKVISANVIRYLKSGSIEIDKGESSGVKLGSSIVYENNLVGKVVSVYKNYSICTPLNQSNIKISFFINSDYSKIGICSGNEKSQIEGYFINNKTVANKGDEVITTGVTKYTPKGFIVGTIISKVINTENSLNKVLINPQVSFNTLVKVGVITS